jgi:hypothetical protein
MLPNCVRRSRVPLHAKPAQNPRSKSVTGVGAPGFHCGRNRVKPPLGSPERSRGRPKGQTSDTLPSLHEPSLPSCLLVFPSRPCARPSSYKGRAKAPSLDGPAAVPIGNKVRARRFQLRPSGKTLGSSCWEARPPMGKWHQRRDRMYKVHGLRPRSGGGARAPLIRHLKLHSGLRFAETLLGARIPAVLSGEIGLRQDPTRRTL